MGYPTNGMIWVWEKISDTERLFSSRFGTEKHIGSLSSLDQQLVSQLKLPWWDLQLQQLHIEKPSKTLVILFHQPQKQVSPQRYIFTSQQSSKTWHFAAAQLKIFVRIQSIARSAPVWRVPCAAVLAPKLPRLPQQKRRWWQTMTTRIARKIRTRGLEMFQVFYHILPVFWPRIDWSYHFCPQKIDDLAMIWYILETHFNGDAIKILGGEAKSWCSSLSIFHP